MANITSKRWVIHVTRAVFIVVAVTTAYYFVVGPIMQSMVFSETATLDGPFQMLNALRRIGHGIEFQYFHGKGTAVLHYPFYALLGGNLNSLTASRYFTSETLYVVAIVVLMMTSLKSWRFRLLLAIFMLTYALFPFTNSVVLPSNSSFGTRIFMPAVIFGVLFLPLGVKKALLLGITLGLAPAISTEQGMAVVASFFGLSILLLPFKRSAMKAQLAFLLLTGAVTVLTFALAVVLVSGGIEPGLRTLQYNFGSVIRDQVWYFGVPPNPFVWRVAQFFSPRFLFIAGMGLIVTVVVGVRLLRSRQPILDESSDFAYAVFLVYGWLAVSGWLFSYSSTQQLQPLLRSTVLTAILLFLRRYEAREYSGTTEGTYYHPAAAITAAISLILIAPSTSTILRDATRSSIDANATMSSTSWVSGYWREYEDAAISAVDQNSETDVPVVWGVYSGYLHNHYNIFNPTQEDYIIHALGDRRAPYFERFRASDPQFVEAPNSTSTAYFEWLLNEDWEFYQRLVLNYELLVTTQHSVIFMRNDQPWREPASECTPYQVEGETFELPGEYFLGTTFPRVLTARLSYEIKNPLHRIPVIGGLPRYLVTIDHSFSTPVSLPPRDDTFTFPVGLTDDKSRTMHFEVRSLLPGVTVHVSTICLTEPALSQENAAFLASSIREWR